MAEVKSLGGPIIIGEYPALNGLFRGDWIEPVVTEHNRSVARSEWTFPCSLARGRSNRSTLCHLKKSETRMSASVLKQDPNA